jgi:tRNA modification GTPase
MSSSEHFFLTSSPAPSAARPVVAALATPPGTGAIAIVRVSGAGCHTMLEKLLRRPLAGWQPGTFRLARLYGESGELIDRALVLLFKAPRSYTGEDAFELQLHGGALPARRALEALRAAGAAPAAPGEFTLRAFLAGKIDLTQAEAVSDLIAARSERAARVASSQLEGALGKRISALSATLVALAADLEAMLDFADDELPQSVPAHLRDLLAAACGPLDGLLATWEEGRMLREGVRIAVAGRPNAGKSTALNVLLGKERAIVSAVPGTTRDTIEEGLVLAGVPAVLVDTAGLRETADGIEREGVKRSREAMRAADFVLVVVDASEPPGDTSWMDAIPSEKSLVLLNKADLPQRTAASDFPGRKTLALSLREDPGAREKLADALAEAVLPAADNAGEGEIAISARHRGGLEDAKAELARAERLLGSEETYVLAAEHVRSALRALGAILGRDTDEETLDAIFSRFCVGK